MTSPSPWTIEQDCARLTVGRPMAVVDLARPGLGLALQRESAVAEGESGVNLLGVTRPDCPAWPGRRADGYVRGDDLAVAYDPQPECPVRVDVVWRVGSTSSAGVRFELILSASTPQLDIRPTLSVSSVLPAGELLQRTDPAADGWTHVGISEREAALPIDGGGCLVWRPDGSAWSYAEMVHPRDVRSGQVSLDGRRLAVSRELFPPSLEKGVILRAWVVGMFVARSSDLASAAEAYAQFATAEPPLGT